jgi:hypothetical protein
MPVRFNFRPAGSFADAIARMEDQSIVLSAPVL